MPKFDPKKYEKKIAASRERLTVAHRFQEPDRVPVHLHGKTFFSGGLNCKDLYYDFATARPSVDHAIRIGAPGGGYALAIGGETYPGVNPDTLVKVVAYAKKVGTYPIQL